MTPDPATPDPASVEPEIRRRADGSIDLDHYDRIARSLRARDQRGAVLRMIAPLARLLGQSRRGRVRPRACAGRAAGGCLSLEATAETKARARGGLGALAIAALLAGWASAPPATAGGVDAPGPVVEVSLPVLVAAMAGWVAAELGEPVPAVLPKVVFVDRATLRARARPGEALPAPGTGGDGDVQAFYRLADATIHLPRGWNGTTAAQASILVHEIVHHFQALREARYRCPAAREELAYEVQQRWLQAHGETLDSAFGIGPLFLLIATNCLF